MAREGQASQLILVVPPRSYLARPVARGMDVSLLAQRRMDLPGSDLILTHIAPAHPVLSALVALQHGRRLEQGEGVPATGRLT